MINPEFFVEVETALPPGLLVRESSSATALGLYGLIRMCRPDHVVEIGSFTGTTTAYLVRAVMENAKGRVTAYETESRFAQTTRETVARACGESAPCEVIAEDFLRVDPVEADFAFIDPDPKSLYIPCFENLRISPGGIVAAHDLALGGESVEVSALADLLVGRGWEIIRFPHERGLLLARLP